MRNFVDVCHNSTVLSIVFITVILFPAIAFSQISTRKYKAGDTYKYKLTTEAWRNNNYSGKTVSIAEHHVVNDGKSLAEEIKWISKVNYNGKDTVRFDNIAQQVTPYRISLLADGLVLLPKLAIPDMVGEVTDLNTFLWP